MGKQHSGPIALVVGVVFLLSAGWAAAGQKEKTVAEPLYATLKTSMGVIA